MAVVVFRKSVTVRSQVVTLVDSFVCGGCGGSSIPPCICWQCDAIDCVTDCCHVYYYRQVRNITDVKDNVLFDSGLNGLIEVL